MIVTEHTIVCDGCGARSRTTDAARTVAWVCAKREGWTATPGTFVAEHWCPACTTARKEH